MVAQLDENVETIVILEMKRVSTVEDGDCAWMALNEPPAPPPIAAAVAVSLLLEAMHCLHQHLHLLH